MCDDAKINSSILSCNKMVLNNDVHICTYIHKFKFRNLNKNYFINLCISTFNFCTLTVSIVAFFPLMYYIGYS